MAAAKGDERAMDGIPVEVKFDNGGYYEAFLMEIINDQGLIHFLCNWMPEAMYPFSHIRFPPANETNGCIFESGMRVEIFVNKTAGHYKGWFHCRIKDIKANFCQFEYGNGMEDEYDFVQLCMVRTENTNPPIDIDMFYTYSIPIPKELHEYAQVENVHKTLKDAIKSALIKYDADIGELVVISRNASDIICAEILHKAHLKSLFQRTRVLQITENLHIQLKIAQKGGFVEELIIPNNLLGVSIGRQKSNYKTATAVDGIWLIYIDRKLNKFVIYGKTLEAVKEARSILEIKTELYLIPNNFLSQLIGRESGNMNSIIESTGIVEIHIPHDEEVPESEKFDEYTSLAIVGTNEAIDKVKIFLEFQVDHIYEVHELRRKQININEKVAEFFKRGQKCEEQLLSSQINLADHDTMPLTQVSPSGFSIGELDDLDDYLLLSDDEDDKIIILEAGKQLNVSGKAIEFSSSENINTIMTLTETDNISEEFFGANPEDKSKEFDCDHIESISDDSEDDVILIENNLCEKIITIATVTETPKISEEASGMQDLSYILDKLRDIYQEKSKEFDWKQTDSIEKDNEYAIMEDETKLNLSMESTDSNDSMITFADTTNAFEELCRMQEVLYRSFNSQISHEKSTEFDGYNIESTEKELNKNLPEETIGDIGNTSLELLLLEQATGCGSTFLLEEIISEINSILLEAENISNEYIEQENQQIDDARLEEQQSSSSEFYDSIENSEGEHENPSRSLELRAQLASSINIQIDSTIKAHNEMFRQFSTAQQKCDLTQTEEYKNSLQALLDLQLKFATISNEISSEIVGEFSIPVGTSDCQLNTTRSISTQIEQDFEKKLDTKTVSNQSEIEFKSLESKSVVTESSESSSKIHSSLIATKTQIPIPRCIPVQPITLKTVPTETDDPTRIVGKIPSKILPNTTKIPGIPKKKRRKLDQICLKNTDGAENVGGSIAKASTPIVIKMVNNTSFAESSRTVIPTKKYIEATTSIKEQTRRVIEMRNKPSTFFMPPEITITQLVPPPGYTTSQPVTPKVTSAVTKARPTPYVVTSKTNKGKVNKVGIKTSALTKIGEVQIKSSAETPRDPTPKPLQPKTISTENSANEASSPFLEVKSAPSKISRAIATPKRQENIKQCAPLMKRKHEPTGMAQVQDKAKCLTPVEHQEKTSKKLKESVYLSKISTPVKSRSNIITGLKDDISKQQVSERSSSSAASTPKTVIFDHDLSLEKNTLPPHVTKYEVSQFTSRESNILSPIDASGDTGLPRVIPPIKDKKDSSEQQESKSRLIDLLWRIGYKGPLLGEELFKAALKGGLNNLEFNVLIVYLTERLHGFMELQKHITPMLNEINSDIFAVELAEFLNQIGCPYEDLVTANVNERLKKRQHRRLLIKFLASEVICNNLLHNESQSLEFQKYLNRNYFILNRDSMTDILKLPVLPTENTVRALEMKFTRYNDTDSSSDDSSQARATSKDN